MSVSVKEICEKARDASYKLAAISAEEKNRMLEAIACAIEKNKEAILEANRKDIEAYTKKDTTFLDRLTLNPKRIDAIISGVKEIIALDDPVGEIVEDRTLKNGLRIKRVRAPLGVIGIIYEARPNVTIDALALCLKSGNSVVLRGGSDAINSNRALYLTAYNALKDAGFLCDCIGFIDDISREKSREMLEMEGLIDVMIPRGGEGLKKFVLEHAKMPVIASAGGNCHVYVDKDAKLDIAERIVLNAKLQRPSVCNAAETLLVHKDLADTFLPDILKKLSDSGVELLGCNETMKRCPFVKEATDLDFATEFECLKLTVKVVDGVGEACDHINKFGTKHSEAIVTENKEAATYFEKNVDAACVYVNASTRFTDGFEFGLGAEMGISTQKLHARGPIALKELTSVKYIVEGNGQIRE
ncbi:MAG: glutamate-5-semialdehyde dehydrogenase [Clostridiales bacterium]|nr:glutamate-5-semialdehyde dehydrogenase [Clostridiales bacterium]